MGSKIEQYLFTGRISQLLFNLRRMPVGCHSICLDTLIDLAVQVRDLGPSSRTGNAGLRVDDQRPHINQSFLCQGIRRQDRAGRIAAWIGHQPRLLHILPVHLAQPVDCLGQELRTLMADFVPLLIDGHILDPEIRAQINDLYLGQNVFIDERRAESLGRGRKDHIRLFCQFFHIIIHAGRVYDPEHISVDIRILLVNIASGAIPYDLRLLVGGQKPHQLASRISGRSDNSCFDHPLHILSHITSKHHIPVLI